MCVVQRGLCIDQLNVGGMRPFWKLGPYLRWEQIILGSSHHLSPFLREGGGNGHGGRGWGLGVAWDAWIYVSFFGIWHLHR